MSVTACGQTHSWLQGSLEVSGPPEPFRAFCRKQIMGLLAGDARGSRGYQTLSLVLHLLLPLFLYFFLFPGADITKGKSAGH